MTDYLLLYSGGSRPETDADQAIVMRAWNAWYKALGDAIVDVGNPFTPAAKSIASDGTVTEGPVGSMASGYTVIKADSLDEAVEMSRGCPVLQGGAQITVYETFSIM
jgi:hypothetical protein